MSEMRKSPKRITMDERALPQIEKSPAQADESTKVIVNKTTCPKSRGDGYQTVSPVDGSNIQVASLCSVDKMRIDHLISELDKCRKLKEETELRLSASKCEKTTLEKRFESCCSKQEDEKLSTEAKELDELTTNTSYSLDILADQMSAWERETWLIRDTVRELLDQKIHLQKEMNRIEMRRMLLAAEETRMNDTVEMNKLQFAKRKLKMDIMAISTSDGCCQTEEMAFQ